jgi:outer membrane protein assembly factor BamB
MVHCTPQMSNDEPGVISRAGLSAAWSFTHTGGVVSDAALGCTVGAQIALCAGSDPHDIISRKRPYLHALDPATGQLLWDSGTLLNTTVATSAPLIDSAGNSYTADNTWMVSFSPTGTVRWQVPNPTGHGVLGFNMTSDGYLVTQGDYGPLLVVAPSTGTIVDHSH